MEKIIIPLEAFIIKYKNVTTDGDKVDVKIEPFNELLWKTKFPFYANVDIRKLQMTNVGIYSISSTDNSKNLINILNEFNKHYKFADHLQDLVVTESNGGIGGFSIRLSKSFREINIVEINSIHADVIFNNLNIYGVNMTDIKIYNKNYLDIMYDLHQDILIFDLPWCGRGYKYIKNLQLGLNNINIWFIINNLYKRNKFKICTLMVPINFDIQNFILFIISPNIIIKKMDKHYFISILNLV